jgi:hypothetical protein
MESNNFTYSAKCITIKETYFGTFSDTNCGTYEANVRTFCSSYSSRYINDADYISYSQYKCAFESTHFESLVQDAIKLTNENYNESNYDTYFRYEVAHIFSFTT